MFDAKSSLRRRVSFSHEHGHLVIRIQRLNDRGAAISHLIGGIFLLGFVGWMFVPPLFRMRSFSDLLYLPLPAVFIGGAFFFFRSGIIGTFGTEEVVVSDGTLFWTRQALFLTRKVEVKYKDITSITPKTLFGGWGRVNVSTAKRTLSIGDQILGDEAREIAEKLRHAARG